MVFIACNHRVENKTGANNRSIHNNVRIEINLHGDVRGKVFHSNGLSI
jgi:hypothetical protein